MKCIKFFCIMLLLFSVFIEPIKVFAEAVHGIEENVVEESLSSDEEMREIDRNEGDTTFSSAESDQTGVEENAKDVFEKYVEDESGSIASLTKNDDFQSEWGNIDYTFGLTISDGLDADIRTWSNQHYLTKENTYFLIKSKEGKYSYGKTVYLPNSGSYISDAKFATRGGEVDTESKKFGASASTTYYFNFKPEFHTFYEGNTKGQDPCKGKDLNYFLNWINFWSFEDVSIIEMEEMSLDHYVRYLNKGVEYQQQDIDFTQSLTVSDGADADIRTWTNQHYLTKEDTYFLIKSKEGKYSYGKTVHLPNSGSYISDAKFVISGGEVDTEARKFGASTSTTYYFNFKPEFHIFYEGVPRAYDPCKGKDLNYFLNWINFWSYEEVSIINTQDIELHVAKKNGLVRDWKFFEMGRSSKNDQFYSLKLSDITRLNFEIIGTTSKVIKIYNKSEQKICETKYAKGNTSFSLDLPSGEYYVVLTGVTAETKLQITRSHFNDLQLSVDTTLNHTTIYVNGQVNQELTDIYAHYNKSFDTQDVVQVTNSLLSIWKKPNVSCESLDMLFGKNLRLSMPSLQHYSLISMGNKPLGSTLYTAPIQYLGQGRYFSEKNIFTMTIGPQPKFLVIDDLFYLALLGTIMVSYSAYVVNTNNLTLTMPSFSGFDVGNWDELDKYEEEMNKVMANPNYKEYKIDCSEIAEDLFAVNPKGTVYNIVAEDGKEFYVSEYGGIKEYYYHVVFSYNGLIYDPRYSSTPVQKDIYFRELQALNTKKLHVYEIQL
ncbi:hypothetical protein [uncultured Enterococcus sp.]|uniref:hypothetical protein n=1 Tax=uncultured Enterococcus sp. TaxID=167972 RepID=UPI002AA7EFA5|nr:hypothetical protein [uncultured Enterococcus sp.]